MSRAAGVRFNAECYNEILNILRKIEKESDLKDNFSEKMCKCLCFELFSVISRNGIEITSGVNKDKDNSAIEKITSYITERYMENITLSEVANEIGLSTTYLSKLFKKSTGLGFKEYLLTVRILNAKKLLKETNLSVATIAFECGFNDSNYFSKIFHIYSECTPLQYRKRKKRPI